MTISYNKILKPSTNLKLSLVENSKIMDLQDLEFFKKGDILSKSSKKIDASNKNNDQYLNAMVYLLQDNLSGDFNVCGNATESCKEICLGTNSGHSALIKGGDTTNVVQIARLRRTKFLKLHRKEFLTKLTRELENFAKYSINKGLIPAVRFNGTSDLAFHTFKMVDSNKTIVDHFGEKYGMVFYDYTKNFNKMVKFLNGDLQSNYHLTFSYTPENPEKAQTILNLGGNVAVAFDEKSKKDKVTKEELTPSFVGKKMFGFPIINGDTTDFRFLDPKGGYIVGLTKKGNTKSTKGFFVNPKEVN